MLPILDEADDIVIPVSQTTFATNPAAKPMPAPNRVAL